MSENRTPLVPDCEKVLLVQAELDGELDAAQAAALETHRAGCPICQAAQEELLRTRALLRREPYEATPDDVRARVMARLRQVEPQVVTHFCDALRGRKLAGQQIRRIAGQQSDQKEDDEGDHQELRQQEKQALPGVAHKSH